MTSPQCKVQDKIKLKIRWGGRVKTRLSCSSHFRRGEEINRPLPREKRTGRTFLTSLHPLTPHRESSFFPTLGALSFNLPPTQRVLPSSAPRLLCFQGRPTVLISVQALLIADLKPCSQISFIQKMADVSLVLVSYLPVGSALWREVC